MVHILLIRHILTATSTSDLRIRILRRSYWLSCIDGWLDEVPSDAMETTSTEVCQVGESGRRQINAPRATPRAYIDNSSNGASTIDCWGLISYYLRNFSCRRTRCHDSLEATSLASEFCWTEGYIEIGTRSRNTTRIEAGAGPCHLKDRSDLVSILKGTDASHRLQRMQ